MLAVRVVGRTEARSPRAGRVAVVGQGTVSILPTVAFVAFAGALCFVSIRATTRAVERLAKAEGIA